LPTRKKKEEKRDYGPVQESGEGASSPRSKEEGPSTQRGGKEFKIKHARVQSALYLRPRRKSVKPVKK